MLAHLQKLITLGWLAAAGGWLLYFGAASPLLAVAGFAAIALAYTGFLAIEFILLKQVNKGDPVPQPTWKELFGAWLVTASASEVLTSLTDIASGTASVDPMTTETLSVGCLPSALWRIAWR